ncbi:hypothetical protein [Streptomyces sp. NBC_00158]|uniref:hypothetical protein n=1 Tax=Streptomyces sp. NBC_00158 TaxID=2903627 RepID=UPI0032504B85
MEPAWPAALRGTAARYGAAVHHSVLYYGVGVTARPWCPDRGTAAGRAAEDHIEGGILRRRGPAWYGGSCLPWVRGCLRPSGRLPDVFREAIELGAYLVEVPDPTAAAERQCEERQTWYRHWLATGEVE